MFAHPYRYIFIAVLSLYTLLNTILCEVYLYFRIEISWYLALLTITGITLLIWEGNRLLERGIRKLVKADAHKIRFVIYFFLIGNLVAALSTIVMVYLVGRIVLDLPLENNVQPFKLNLIYATLVNLFFHLMNTILLFFHNYKKQWIEAEELRRISTQAQLQLIKNQVNPHFLFNNLNVLSAMVIRENPDANKFIEEFSKVYRYVLSNQENELVLLESEMEVIQPYIYMLNKRFSNGLVVEIDVPAKYTGHYVIPVALQMLLENAIKHNIVSAAHPLNVKIFVLHEGYLTVRNNLQVKQQSESSTQIGLNNISQRYQLVNGSNIIVNKTDREFEISIPLLQVN